MSRRLLRRHGCRCSLPGVWRNTTRSTRADAASTSCTVTIQSYISVVWRGVSLCEMWRSTTGASLSFFEGCVGSISLDHRLTREALPLQDEAIGILKVDSQRTEVRLQEAVAHRLNRSRQVSWQINNTAFQSSRVSIVSRIKSRNHTVCVWHLHLHQSSLTPTATWTRSTSVGLMRYPISSMLLLQKLWSRSGTYVPRQGMPRRAAMLPHLTWLCNVSIRSGCLPVSQNTATVMPRLKKSGLDPAV